jgi:uncharacterized protein YegP (UPF0339 family)
MSVRPNGLTYPCYWMYVDAKKEWRWVYYGKNGEEISVSSEGYTSKQNCRNGVSLMQASHASTVFEPKAP